eukprot:1160573-Pelagomonas_calceolata.AAC.32
MTPGQEQSQGVPKCNNTQQWQQNKGGKEDGTRLGSMLTRSMIMKPLGGMHATYDKPLEWDAHASEACSQAA